MIFKIRDFKIQLIKIDMEMIEMITIVNNLDLNILFFIQSTLHYPILDKIMIVSTQLGDKGLIWIGLSFVLLTNRKTRTAGILSLTALVLSTIVGEGILKHLFQRERPYVDFPWVHLLVGKSTSFSFPSGHTTSSFAVAYVLSRVLKKHSYIFWAFAILIAFSRLYLFMHYPTDVIAGIIVGLACGKITISLFENKMKGLSLKQMT